MHCLATYSMSDGGEELLSADSQLDPGQTISNRLVFQNLCNHEFESHFIARFNK